MKFFVKSIGRRSTSTRGNAILKTANPQYLRSGETLAENNDSGAMKIQFKVIHDSVINHTIDDYSKKFLK
jgi:hypothetical protein